MLRTASICSVTFIVPSSAVRAPPMRPASMTAASTGPSSFTTEILISTPQVLLQAHAGQLIVGLDRQRHSDERAR